MKQNVAKFLIVVIRVKTSKYDMLFVIIASGGQIQSFTLPYLFSLDVGVARATVVSRNVIEHYSAGIFVVELVMAVLSVTNAESLVW